MRKALTAALFLVLLLATHAEAFHPGEASEREGVLPSWTERIHLNGTIEGDLAWADRSDVTDGDSDATSDLFISTLELGVEIDFIDWLSGGVVFLAEDLGTEDESDVAVDEAALTFQAEGFPVYLVFGKRVQPFGVFENHLVTDPMTQDAYETNRVGATVGITGRTGLDLSATVYRGEEMMAHLFESELFDTDAVARVADPAGDDVSSFILSASFEPVPDHLSVFGSFISEPGSGDRNETASVGLSLSFNGIRLDGEYMKAVTRERYAGFSREFKEGVLSLAAAYEFVVRQREVLGGALFSERKAHIVAEPLEVAVRYEHFDDDGMADVSQTQSVEDRYGAGVRYSFYSDPESGLAAYAAAEVRHTDYRLHPLQVSQRADDKNEIFMRLGVTF